jgi:CheY-like chemotaxis protein
VPSVLVVDDIPDNVALLALELQDRGYKVISASDGPSALELAASTPPDVILLDVMMPGMDGIEVCKRLKANPLTEPIPVLLISARIHDQDVLRGLDNGAQDYITKPFNGAIVAARVQAAVNTKHLRAAAETLGRAKTDFLASMSHEIRTPMNAILGLTELTLKSALEPQQRGNLEIIKEAARDLLALIDDILDLSKAEGGMLELDQMVFNLHDQLEGVMRLLAPKARIKGLEFHLHIAPEIPERLVGDSRRLRQVLMNLAGNALKFTERGEVVISVDQVARESRRLVLRFRVTDTGIGVPADKRETIFKPFVQADRSTARRYGGTGLGLSISSRLVKLMDGEIRALAGQEGGSIFEFTAVFEPGPEVAPMAEPSTLSEPMMECDRCARILLAEDHPFNQRVAVQMLRSNGHTVRVVHNGREAVEAFSQEPFDLVLMDVQMPEMDGIQATIALRAAEGGKGRSIPIVGLTAYTMEKDHRRCVDAGMNEILVKPISIDSLLKVVGQQLLMPSGRGSRPGAANSKNELTSKTVDVDAALARVDGDLTFLREMTALFVVQCPASLEIIRSMLWSGHLAQACAPTHELQNWAHNFHAEPTAAAALALERACCDGDAWASGQALEALEAEIGRLLLALDRLIQ